MNNVKPFSTMGGMDNAWDAWEVYGYTVYEP